MSDHKSRPARRVPDPLTARPARWRAEATDEEYLAAQKHLMLLFDDDVAALITDQFRDAPATRVWDAPTLLHAASLPLLGRDDPHVTRELVHIAGRDKLSPVLFLRGSHRRPPVIVNGYHRICAAFHCDPDALIHVKLV